MLFLAKGIVARREPLANIIFHSSELIPGGSPYNATDADVDRFYDALRELLSFLSNQGVEGRTFREFRDEWVTGDTR